MRRTWAQGWVPPPPPPPALLRLSPPPPPYLPPRSDPGASGAAGSPWFPGGLGWAGQAGDPCWADLGLPDSMSAGATASCPVCRCRLMVSGVVPHAHLRRSRYSPASRGPWLGGRSSSQLRCPGDESVGTAWAVPSIPPLFTPVSPGSARARLSLPPDGPGVGVIVADPVAGQPAGTRTQHMPSPSALAALRIRPPGLPPG